MLADGFHADTDEGQAELLSSRRNDMASSDLAGVQHEIHLTLRASFRACSMRLLQ